MTPYQQQLLTDCNAVLQIKDSYGWQVILRDAKANFEALSNTWFDLPDGSKELLAARARQMANQTIINLMDMYEDRLNEVGMEAINKENPDLIQTTDVDNGIEEDADE